MAKAKQKAEPAEAEVEAATSAEADGDTPEPELSPQEARLAELERERDEYLDLAQRTRAEFDNFRKRSARDSQDAERRGRARVAGGLVPAVDNLERALQAAGVDLAPTGPAGTSDPTSREVSAHEALAAGVALVHGEIVSALRASGVESFDPTGERFDPSRHEALSARPASDDEEAGIVVETLQRGYSLGDVLIRPARVVVTS
ncbi:MAG: nucleotide exchange factor GrpE [Actinomycetota bacterium]|nr:nucleotide exchange factor GrpE [Actinomycetota bacterium]